jgi:uncharacterized protein
MISELSEQQSRELLGAGRLGRLGCCLNGKPYVVPVYYLLEGDSIYIHSLPGQKIDMLRANPNACLQVDEIKNDYHWRSVIAFGRYEEITGDQERERVLAALFAHLPQLTPVEAKMTGDSPQSIVFRLHITSVTSAFERFP